MAKNTRKTGETVTTPKGGRPSEHARNMAVLMARWWRTVVLEESVKAADIWILDYWQNHNEQGVTESSSIRRAIRKADRDLAAHRYKVLRADGVPPWMWVTPQPITQGAPTWGWCEGLTRATRGTVENLRIVGDQISFRVPVPDIPIELLKNGPTAGDLLVHELKNTAKKVG